MSLSSIRDHAVHAFVDAMLEMLRREEFSSPDVSGSESYAFARDKCFAVLSLLAELLKSCPPELASESGLATLYSNLQAPSNELTSFLNDHNANHIVTAATLVDQQVTTYFWAVPFRGELADRHAIGAVLTRYSEAALQAHQQLQVRHAEIDARYQAMQQRALDLETKLDDLVSMAAKERADAAAAVSKLNQSFTEREGERQVKFDAALGELRDVLAATNETAKSQAAEVLVKLAEHRDNAARIVQVVGNIGATGNYQRIADAEMRQADGWRFATVAFFSLGILLAGATFYKFWGLPLTTETGLGVLVRLLYAFAITAPAWYTARESARHRTNADRARQTELELASIGPFIELLPEEKKVLIREQLTPLYFGRAVDQHTVEHPLDPAKLKDLLVDLAKAIKTA